MTPQEFTARYFDATLARLVIPANRVWPVLAIVIGYKVPATDNRGAGWGARLWLGRVPDESLFYNGVVFARVMTLHPLAWLWLLGYNAIAWLLVAGGYALANLAGGTHLTHSLWWLVQPVAFFGVSVRWAGRNPAVREFLQLYLPGWKLSGKFSAVFRVQSDQSGAAGFTSPNYGQAQGWGDGPK